MVKIDGSQLNISQTTLHKANLATESRSLTRILDSASLSLASSHGKLAALFSQGLRNRLQNFQTALASFSWPDDSSGLRNARLVVGDPALAGYATGQVQSGDDAGRYYKAFSRGFTGVSPTQLDAGSYKLELSLGGETEKLTIDVAATETNADVLESVRDAINQADLPVQAEVVTQSGPNQRIKGLLATGTALALTVNKGFDTGGVGLKDYSGTLVRSLDLKATETPAEPATTGRYDLRGTMAGNPTSFVSRDFDPNQTTGLPAGDYPFTYTYGAASGSLSLHVESDESWKDVLQNLSSLMNSSQDDFTAAVESLEKPYYDPRYPDMVMRERAQMKVAADAPKLGERLILSEDAAQAPDGATGLLASLRLTSTAAPGADSSLAVNQTGQSRSPGLFTQDSGRLVIGLEKSFGQDLPLRVVEAVAGLEDSLAAISEAYNSLTAYLDRDSGLWEEELANAFRQPVEDEKEELDWLGLASASNGNPIYFSADEFYSALRQDPDRVEEALAGPDGLVTAWKAEVDAALARDAGSYLRDPDALKAIEKPLTLALENQFRALLTDLYG